MLVEGHDDGRADDEGGGDDADRQTADGAVDLVAEAAQRQYVDLDFALDLQKKRLDEKGVKIQTAFTDKETVKDETPVNACTAYDMGECKSNIASKTYEVTEKYFKDGKKKKKIKDRFFFYTMITRLENRNSEVACSCPNCGAVSSVRELLNGCKNCKTRFIMDDLFPKVTNFYFVKT